MAEAIGVVSSVISIIQIADRIIGLCKFYIEAASNTPSELRTMFIEVSTLKTIFENLEFLRKTDEETWTRLKKLSKDDGPIQGCLKSVKELETLFPSDSVPILSDNSSGRSKRRKVKAAFDILAWPLKASHARRLLDQIIQYKTSITFALTTEIT